MTAQVAIVTGGVVRSYNNLCYQLTQYILTGLMIQSGIGAELTRTLIRRGWRVAAFDIPAQKELADKLTGEFGNDAFVYYPCDISDYDQQADAFTSTFQKWGRIDALCANAGIIDRGSIFIRGHKDKSKSVFALSRSSLYSKLNPHLGCLQSRIWPAQISA